MARYYFQARRDVKAALEVVAPKLANSHGCEIMECDAGYYLRAYEASGAVGEEYDLSAADLEAFGLWAAA